jgi:hypothetical protein
MNIYEKLLKIQSELKCNKGQYNSFGGYKYRSCEDILEAVKPLCVKYGVVLTLDDTLENIGNRYYIKAIAKIVDIEEVWEDLGDGCKGLNCITNVAYARESETKKGMDESQITGTASSYARKYALNGLFCIDDTKDADTDKFINQQKKVEEIEKNKLIDKKQRDALEESIKANMFDVSGKDKEVLAKFNYKAVKDIKIKDYMSIVNEFRKIKGGEV